MNYTKIRKEEFEKLKSLFPDNEEIDKGRGNEFDSCEYTLYLKRVNKK